MVNNEQVRMEKEWILVMMQHPLFGWRFHLHSAELTDNGSTLITGSPTPEQLEISPNRKVWKRLMKLTSDISDQGLMKSYSQKKTLTEFKRELTPETLEGYIRPRIQRNNKAIIEEARHTDVLVYFRDDVSQKALYDRYRIFLNAASTHCRFHFIKREAGLSYHITLTNGEREISLQTQKHLILSEKPCIILLNDEVHCVENIEAVRLTPFLTKTDIHIPEQALEEYLKRFVFKTILSYDVKIEGIPLREVFPPRQAILSLEQDFGFNFVLVLHFVYGDEPKMLPVSNTRKMLRLKREGGGFAIDWFARDEAWEKRLIQRLKELGLRAIGESSFGLETEGNAFRLIEWLNENRQQLAADFEIERLTDQPFYTGELTIHSDYREKIDWFEVEIVVVAGRFRIPFKAFRRHILAGKREYLLPDATIAILPDEWFERYQELMKYGTEGDAGLRVKKMHTPLMVTAFENRLPIEKLRRLEQTLVPPTTPPELPSSIRAELRPYQKRGFYWLANLEEQGFGGCLADDMGLGKTLQTITLLQSLYDDNEGWQAKEENDGQLSLFAPAASRRHASLVVAPTSLLHNWRNELQRFAPRLKVLIYTGNNRLREKAHPRTFDCYDVVVTSYGLLRNDIDFLKHYRFQTMIVDESQYIKNRSSLVYKAVKQIEAEQRLALTGTPIENSLEDLWTQFDFINEGLLGNFSTFRDEFIHPIVKEKSVVREQLLKRRIHPFLLRRTKEEVTPELPPLIQQVIYCDMTDEHRELYDREKNRIRNELLLLKEEQDNKNNFVALQGLNRLRQLANHPRMVVPDYAEGSGKFEQILHYFESLRAENHKVLIFSSYVKHLQLLAQRFDEEGWGYAMLTGETIKREEEIDRFLNDDRIHAFLISLKAGSTGLNLTAADYVFLIDPWWNPAAEMQALSRAHRIGQEKPVIAYRFISTETVEEKILKLQESKTELFETFVNAQSPIDCFDWEEIDGLLA
ncbi:DEAD/DEAH box helicase [Parabacteroides sp. OttesenSCG-928-N08]|nr:DEAD/DEAH box helicase [Parabacteroides sp. OttesenSCG-928-N08]